MVATFGCTAPFQQDQPSAECCIRLLMQATLPPQQRVDRSNKLICSGNRRVLGGGSCHCALIHCTNTLHTHWQFAAPYCCGRVVEGAHECPCGHLFCGVHIKQWLGTGNLSCPTCRAETRMDQLKVIRQAVRAFTRFLLACGISTANRSSRMCARVCVCVSRCVCVSLCVCHSKGGGGGHSRREEKGGSCVCERLMVTY